MAVLILLIAACGERGAPATAQVPEPPSIPPLPRCPVAPADSGITIKETMGPDFYICDGQTPAGDNFQIYVGNFPEKVPGLEFYAVLYPHGNNIVWLASARPKNDSERLWVAYVPYGANFPSVAAISYRGTTRSDFMRVATSIGKLRFSVQ